MKKDIDTKLPVGLYKARHETSHVLKQDVVDYLVSKNYIRIAVTEELPLEGPGAFTEVWTSKTRGLSIVANGKSFDPSVTTMSVLQGHNTQLLPPLRCVCENVVVLVAIMENLHYITNPNMPV